MSERERDSEKVPVNLFHASLLDLEIYVASPPPRLVFPLLVPSSSEFAPSIFVCAHILAVFFFPFTLSLPLTKIMSASPFVASRSSSSSISSFHNFFSSFIVIRKLKENKQTKKKKNERNATKSNEETTSREQHFPF